MKLKPYPHYQDSALPWLGQIPAHWEIGPGLSAFRENKRKNTGLHEKTILSLSYGRVIVKPAEKRGLVPDSFETYQILEPGDIVIRGTDLQNDVTSLRVGLVRDVGIITSAYLGFKTVGDFSGEFGYWLLHAYDLQKVLYGLGSGLRQNLAFSDFKRLPIVIPPREEQDLIVRFLRVQDARFARLIGVKRRMMALLNEQKSALIQRAVTRGLDPNARFKDSGLPWLGQVPEHWEESKIKHQFKSLNPKRIPLSSSERGEMTNRTYDYYGASGVIDKVEDYIFDDELILIAEDGANLVLRNLPLAIIARGKFWVNNHAHILKPKTGDLKFLAFLLESIDYNIWISGAAQPKLTQDRLMSVSLFVPPLAEQRAIVAHIEAESAQLNAALERIGREIALIGEYRTRLVCDVVTGQWDVRALAQSWPDVEDAPAFGEALEDDEIEEDGEDSDESIRPMSLQ